MWRIGSSRFSDSILITSAPRSDSRRVASDPAMAHVKSTMRTPASGWRGSGADRPRRSRPPSARRAATSATASPSAPSAGAGAARPAPRLDRNGEPASRTTLAVGALHVDEEVARREVAVDGDVGDLVDRQHEQPAGLALGDELGPRRRRRQPGDAGHDLAAGGRRRRRDRSTPVRRSVSGPSTRCGPLDEARPVRRVDGERRPQAVAAQHGRAAGDLLVPRRHDAVPVEQVAVRRLERGHDAPPPAPTRRCGRPGRCAAGR